MYTTLKEREKDFRIIYDIFYDYPRIKISFLWKKLKLKHKTTARNRLKEALSLGYIMGPEIRKKSYGNLIEHMCYFNCEDPEELFEKLKGIKNIFYHNIMDGFANFRIISDKEISVDGDILVKGPRSNYYISFAPDHSWEEAIRIMLKMMKRFDPDLYTPKNILQTLWNETVTWTKIDEILFREMKYNFRKFYTPIMQKYNIHKYNIDQWLKKVPECCTIATGYFPKTIKEYDPYIFMFETDYEDFVIDLFSQLPTTSWFYMVADKLFTQIWVERGSMRNIDHLTRGIGTVHMRLLVKDLLKRKIVKSKKRAAVACYWRDEPGDF